MKPSKHKKLIKLSRKYAKLGNRMAERTLDIRIKKILKDFDYAGNDQRMDFIEDRIKLANNHGYCTVSEAIKELYEAGFSVRQIAPLLEYDSDAIRIHLGRMGVKMRPKGGSNYQGKLCNLTPEEIKFIRESGMTQKGLGLIFNLSQTSICKLINSN